MSSHSTPLNKTREIENTQKRKTRTHPVDVYSPGTWAERNPRIPMRLRIRTASAVEPAPPRVRHDRGRSGGLKMTGNRRSFR